MSHSLPCLPLIPYLLVGLGFVFPLFLLSDLLASKVCGTLVPSPGIKPLPPVSAVRSPWFCFSMHLLTALFPPLIQGKIHKTILKWTISGILVIHRAVQPLRLPNFRTPSPQEEPVSLLLCTESLQPLPSVFVGLPVLGVSCKQPYSM